MEAKKITLDCRHCREEMIIDFATEHFSSENQIINGKKQQKRTFVKKCPHCETINTVSSNKKKSGAIGTG